MSKFIQVAAAILFFGSLMGLVINTGLSIAKDNDLSRQQTDQSLPR